MFNWLYNQIRSAVAGGVAAGLADVGVLPADATPEQVRAAIAGSMPAVEDKPKKRKE